MVAVVFTLQVLLCVASVLSWQKWDTPTVQGSATDWVLRGLCLSFC